MSNLEIDINSDQFALLKLARSHAITPRNLIKLLATHSNKPQETLNFIQENSSIIMPSDEQIFRELNALNEINGQIISYLDPRYPKSLKALQDPPIILSAIGNTRALNQGEMFGIVGSRDSSLAGEKFTKSITKSLSEVFTIVSGLANGIDKVAHETTIENHGTTIAVIGSGLSTPYPNPRLANEIVESNGLVISEVSFFQSPQPKLFPARNRIIAALSKGVLVVEAALKSGSIITAREAKKYGKPVFAVPGSPFDPRASGTNHLIKGGATMVSHVNDILSQLQKEVSVEQYNLFEKNYDKYDLQDVHKKILAALDYKNSISPDELMERCNDISESEFIRLLTELNFLNLITQDLHGKIILV